MKFRVFMPIPALTKPCEDLTAHGDGMLHSHTTGLALSQTPIVPLAFTAPSYLDHNSSGD
ncbi:hypothetical protein [Shewanella sp.]|uniref:hypothetical protein n=1 Tax=Shewanella sp. TaxID=50422 RepID=UPI003A96B285